MNSILNKNLFFVKEQVGMFKASNNFDIYDPNTKNVLLTCREENLGFFTKIFRFTDYKRMTPFDIEVKTTSGERILSVRRGFSIFRSTVKVFDEKDNCIGIFKQQFALIGSKFNVLDNEEHIICTLQGKWTSWDFKFTKDKVEYAQVTKKWAGIGKELFTTADNYVLEIKDTVAPDSPLRQLVLAAVLCIDMVLKE